MEVILSQKKHYRLGQWGHALGPRVESKNAAVLIDSSGLNRKLGFVSRPMRVRFAIQVFGENWNMPP